MNYELAKKLKDAGFPVKLCECEATYVHPTPEELMEACGEGFKCLLLDPKDGSWVASDNVIGHKYQGRGKTIKEALTKLWKNLNQ